MTQKKVSSALSAEVPFGLFRQRRIDEKVDFAHLYSLWDGGANDGKEICGNLCGGKCCHKVEKTLVPGEYEYLLSETGQKNHLWNSPGCLCDETGFKPVICRTYPLNIHVDDTGWYIAGVHSGAYSNKCGMLDFTKQEERLSKFLDYLFSFPRIRDYWFLSYSLNSLVEMFKDLYQQEGVPLDVPEEDLSEALSFRIMAWYFGFQLDHRDTLIHDTLQLNATRSGDRGFSNLIVPQV